MSDQDKDLEVARSMADAVESLPMDDPLRMYLAARSVDRVFDF